MEYDSIAPDDRTQEEIAALNNTVEEEVSWWQNRILWIVVGSIIAIAITVFAVVLIKNNIGSKKITIPMIFRPYILHRQEELC